MNQPARACSRGGFTLTESMIASVVLAACVVGIGGTLSAAYKNSQHLEENAAATTLARQMMEEIISRGYADGPGADDSVFDYRNRTWSTASAITTSSGSQIALPGGGTYTRRSDVAYFDSVDDLESTPRTNLDPLPPVAVVTVTVTTPAGKAVSLVQVIAEQ